MKKVKAVLIGDVGVGKTSLIEWYKKRIPEQTRPTLGVDFFQVEIYSDDEKVELTIVDTAGAVNYRDLIPMYLKDVSVCVLIFSHNKKETLENIKDWHSFVLEMRKGYCQFLLVGNKSDEKSVFTEQEIKNVATEIEALKYISTSALTGQNVDDLFNFIARDPLIPSSYEYEKPLRQSNGSNVGCC